MVTASDLRISNADILGAIKNLEPGEPFEDRIEYFAAIAWSVICEPGDGFAGLIIRQFGAAKALQLLLEETTPKRYLELFAERGSDDANRFGRFEKHVLDASERWSSRMQFSKVLAACDAMKSLGGWFITNKTPNWPTSLNDLEDHAPQGLWGLGEFSALTTLNRAISFVGSRVATRYGQEVCATLIEPLVERNFAIVSGGAYGIDTASHMATIGVGGATFSLMAGGLDKLYPSGNRELFKSILPNGALLAEMAPGSQPTKWRFLQRNRLIAALGLSTTLVEANPRSGAISTANRANQLDRPVGAVPGAINLPGSQGCHDLIRSGRAALITCHDDILELVESSTGLPEEGNSGWGALETRVYDVIGFTGADVTRICSEAGLTYSEAEIGLASLSLYGAIFEDSTGWHRTP